jgi:catechol 2,3-dioxygenase-like lactoylglutathione lyase family enzyme
MVYMTMTDVSDVIAQVQADLLDPNGQPIIRARLHHFGIATTRYDEMLEWYRHVIGLEVHGALPTSQGVGLGTFVTNDLEHHRGGFFHPPFLVNNDEHAAQARVQHLAWDYETLEDMVATWFRLEALGIHSRACACHGSSFAFYYSDPDSNTVELTTDAWPEPAQALAFHHSPEFAANPFGKFVDPPKLRAALEAGADLDEMRVRAQAGEFEPEVLPSIRDTW